MIFCVMLYGMCYCGVLCFVCLCVVLCSNVFERFISDLLCDVVWSMCVVLLLCLCVLILLWC